MKKYTLAFSPCPNDTFIFDAMVHQKIDTKGFQFDYVLEDVETLNQWALEGRHDISKVSYSVLSQLLSTYRLFQSGSALGRGVGPLLLSKQPLPEGVDLKTFLEQSSIAIPGQWTTAHFIFSIAFPNASNKQAVIFSEIEQGLIDNRFDIGLVIHESRFTYQEKGLYCLMDMGSWWEQNMHAPIPLGGIVVSKQVPEEDAKIIEGLITESIQYAWQHYPQLGDFVTQNAQEMNEDVMRQHINLYVNSFSENLGQEGQAVVNLLIEKAKTLGLCPAGAQLEWVSGGF